MSADPLCLDPHQISSDVEQLLGNIQFDNLTFLGKNGQPEPWLATSWKITNGGKTYTFQLKQGVTFSDGAPFNAAAVVANFQQMLNPATRSALAGPYIEPYQSSKILGTYTLQVNLETTRTAPSSTCSPRDGWAWSRRRRLPATPRLSSAPTRSVPGRS